MFVHLRNKLIKEFAEKMIKFSLIIPVYNVEKYLKRCVNSILAQDCGSMEIILIDDGSTDSSPELCDQLAAKHSEIQVIHKANEGLGLTRNLGIQMAKGEYLLFVDSDDYLAEYSLERLYVWIHKHNDDVCFFLRNKVNRNGIIQKTNEKIPTKLIERKELISMCLGESLKQDTFEIGPAWKAVYKTSFLKENDLSFLSEREILSEDYIFSAYVCAKEITYSFYNVPIYHYCDNTASLTNSYRKDRAIKAINLFHKMMEIASEEDLGENAVDRITNNFLINILVSMKHICLNKNMSYSEKLGVMKEISSNQEVMHILRKYMYTDSFQLKILRIAIMNDWLFLIYIMINLRYKLQNA